MFSAMRRELNVVTPKQLNNKLSTVCWCVFCICCAHIFFLVQSTKVEIVNVCSRHMCVNMPFDRRFCLHFVVYDFYSLHFWMRTHRIGNCNWNEERKKKTQLWKARKYCLGEMENSVKNSSATKKYCDTYVLSTSLSSHIWIFRLLE